MRRLTGSFLAAGMLATGGVTAAALGVVSPAGADDTKAHDPAEVMAAPAGGAHRLREALDGLVENGTITAAQADAVVGALADEFPRVARLAHRWNLVGDALRAGADVIGIDQAELRSELVDGKSLAEVASDHGVSREDLIAGLIDAATTRLDAAVADGHLTAERAGELKERVTESLPDLVDRSFDRPFVRPGRVGPWRPFGPDHRGGQAD